MPGVKLCQAIQPVKGKPPVELISVRPNIVSKGQTSYDESLDVLHLSGYNIASKGQTSND